MSRIITIDFETLDHGIQNSLGPGWPWGGCEILGMSWKVEGMEEAEYETDIDKIKEIIAQSIEDEKIIVAHNASYEAGIIKMLGFDMRKVKIRCTLIIAKLVNNILKSFSLENLAQYYLKESKITDTMVQTAIEFGLITPLKSYYGKPESKAYQAAHSKAKRELWSILHHLQEASDVVANYANRDVEVTERLYHTLVETGKVDEDVIEKFCLLINVVTDIRSHGVRVDIKRVYEVRSILNKKLTKCSRTFWDACGYINYNSPKAVETWAKELGYPPERDLTGRLGYGDAWIKANSDDNRVVMYGNCKRYHKAIGFTESIIKYEVMGRVHPELNIMEAVTGRFSSTNPNIQQIPSRDPEIGPLIRSLYLPEEGEKWFSLDFSAQEPRIAAHFAVLCHENQLPYKVQVPAGKNPDTGRWEFKWAKDTETFNCPAVVKLKSAYDNDPQLDSHEFNRSLIQESSGVEITRKATKTIALGIMYGMGKAKLANSLGLSVDKAKQLINAFNQGSPFVKMLSDMAQYSMFTNGDIKTLGGRRSKSESGAEYKALNKLIQGSAFDQTALCLVEAWKAGLTVLNTVHDEINISGTKDDAAKLKQIMENTIKLLIPSFTDIGEGESWAEAK